MEKSIVLKCSKCGRYYVCGKLNDVGSIDRLNNCQGIMQNTGMTHEEYVIIAKVTKDDNHALLQAMIELKKKDIIEYNLKMAQFGTQVLQQENFEEQKYNQIHCPRCGSTKVSIGQKGYTGLLGFIGSGDTVNRCGACGHIWRP